MAQSPRVRPQAHSPPPRDALALMRGRSPTSMAQPPRVRPRAHFPPPRDALALMRGRLLTSMAEPPRVRPRAHSLPPHDALALRRGQSLTSMVQPPRPRAHSLPPRDALALMRGQSLTSMAQLVTASSPPHHATLPALPAPKPGVSAQKESLLKLDLGKAMSGGDPEEPAEDLSTVLNDWSAAQAAMERAICPLRDRVEIGRETRERLQERCAVEEEVPVLHKRKMKICEDAEPGPLGGLRFPLGLEHGVSETLRHIPFSGTDYGNPLEGAGSDNGVTSGRFPGEGRREVGDA